MSFNVHISKWTDFYIYIYIYIYISNGGTFDVIVINKGTEPGDPSSNPK